MKKLKIFTLLLFLFLAGDTLYSFLEYYFIPIDGDLTYGTLPWSPVTKVINDPFGFNLLISGEKHVNPNRFFSHYFLMSYMRQMPLLLQRITDPITSVYLSCALIKLFVHLLLLILLAKLITGNANLFSKAVLLSAVLIVPLIQANGYWGHMGINDKATTYTFFYALPLVLLLLYLKPVYEAIHADNRQKIKWSDYLLVVSGSVILPLSGPLNPGVILIVSLLTFLFYLQKTTRPKNPIGRIISTCTFIPGKVLFYLIPASVVSLYSLFLGLFDSNYQTETIPLVDRYLKLPIGIYYQISQSLGVPLLIALMATNLYFIKKHFSTAEYRHHVILLRWVGLFALIYLLLLPLGGYRPYRPNILRYDTLIPITIAALFFFGNSSYLLATSLKGPSLKYYAGILIPVFAIYMNADKLKTREYACERNALETLAASPDDVTLLPNTCNVMAWEILTDPERTEINAEMLKFWNITKEKKRYYQLPH